MSVGSILRRLSRRLVPRPATERACETSKQPHCQVLFVNGCDLPTLHRYRVEHQREQLEMLGVSTDEVHYCSVRPEDADRADVFVIYRCPITDGVSSFIERLHTQGKMIYFDVDDLVTDTRYTDSLPVVRSMAQEDRAIFNDGVERNGRTLALCDGAIVTTERLAKELGRVAPRVFINRNVASREMVRNSMLVHTLDKGGRDDVLIGYFSGSMTHNSDFAQALPAILSVLDERSNVCLKVVGDLGIPDVLTPYADRIVRSEKVSWEELPALIASVDINLAPLEPTLFNEAKSENKWTEAALVKVPTVASNFGAFSDVIEDGENGFLCSTTEDWVDALILLIDDPSLRKRVGEAAYRSCLLGHTTARTGFPLAHLLCGTQTDIEHMVPGDEELQSEWVDAHLLSRGVSRRALSYDPEPWQAIQLDSRLEEVSRAKEGCQRVLAFVYERNCGDSATFRYFAYNLIERLRESTCWTAVHLFVDELKHVEGRIDDFDVLILVRCRIRPELVSLAKAAKARSIPIAYLIDDNAIGAETAPRIIEAMASDPNSEFEQSFWRGATTRFDLASQLADALIVPNDYFAQHLRAWTDKPVLVIHSSLNDEQVQLAQEIANLSDGDFSDGRFLVGYFSGTSSHQEDFGIVEPALLSFLSQHDDTQLLIGGCFRLSESLYKLYLSGRVTVMPKVDYCTLQYLQASVDVVLAPLIIDSFTNCKSALKVFEAGIVGTPACASPSFSYREAIEPGVTGFICSSESEWLDALDYLYSNRTARLKMRESARSFAREHYYGKAITMEVEGAAYAVSNCTVMPIPDRVLDIMSGTHVNDWDDPFEVNPLFA